MKKIMCGDIIIAIPIYKEILSAIELASLNQVFSILGDYPIVFIAPEYMRIYLEKQGYIGEYFSDNYFVSTVSYSRLLLSEEFYIRFLDYEYMLIYQLDAFVFSNKLEYFCSLGYDYIGAPWLMCSRPRFDASVGNGGFSLRKVKSCLRMLQHEKFVAEISNMRDRYLKFEDNFFALCGKIPQLDFKMPSLQEALSFAVEQNVSHCYSRIGAWLPFGCHGWDRDSFEVWNPIIAKYLSPKQLKNVVQDIKIKVEQSRKKHIMGFAQLRATFLLEYLIKRIFRSLNPAACEALGKCIPCGFKYVLWGNGFWGRDAVSFLDRLNVSLACIWDEQATNRERKGKLPVSKPDWAAFDVFSQRIIITTRNYAEEICAILSKRGLIKNKHFFVYDEIREKFVSHYYSSLYYKLFGKKLGKAGCR